MSALMADRRLFVTADRSEVVEEGDLRAAFLLVGPGAEIAPADVDRYGLAAKGDKIVLPAPPKPKAAKAKGGGDKED